MTNLEQTRETIANYGIRIIVDNCHVHSDDPDLMGYYDARHNTIHIADGLTETQKIVTLTHELIHALHFLNNTADPNPKYEEEKTLKETALQLVDPSQLAYEQIMYETDYRKIADEMNVTESVIADYLKSRGVVFDLSK